MSVFDELVGQDTVRRHLEHAARNQDTLAQAWLFTGPPGSGRSIAARTLAAALQCTSEEKGCGKCHACTTVMNSNHPDVDFVTTQGVTITANQTREIVRNSYSKPSTGKYRIIIIEDADRMQERTTNILLKAI